jgi:predicted anti-sigma-YlaC factor YlaD
MRCREAQKLLSNDLDGALNERRRPALQTHVGKCPHCRQFAADLARCRSALERVTPPEPRPDFTDRLMKRVAVTPQPRGLRPGRVLLQLSRAVAAVLALAGGIYLARSMNGAPSAHQVAAEEAAQSFYADWFEPLPSESAAAQFVGLLRPAEE